MQFFLNRKNRKAEAGRIVAAEEVDKQRAKKIKDDREEILSAARTEANLEAIRTWKTKAGDLEEDNIKLGSKLDDVQSAAEVILRGFDILLNKAKVNEDGTLCIKVTQDEFTALRDDMRKLRQHTY